MLDPTTAELLLPHASGVALDILFSDAAGLDYGLSAPPSNEAVLARWPNLSSADACTLAGALTDDRLLDDLVTRERRKSVRRALAANEHLHAVTRLHLLQQGLSSRDDELVANALGSSAPADGIAMFINDPSLPFSEHTLAKFVAAHRDLEDAARVVAITGIEIIALVARHDIMFAIDVSEQTGVVMQQLGRRLNVRRVLPHAELSDDDFRRIIAAVGEEHGIPYVAHVFGDDFQRMLQIDPRVARHALRHIDVVDSLVASFCVSNGLVDALELDDVSIEKGALGVLFADDTWREFPALLLHHPDKDEVLAMVDDLHVVLAAVVGSGNATLAGEWLASMSDRFSPAVFWSLVTTSGVRVDRRVANAFRDPSIVASLFAEIPEPAFLHVDALPTGVDLLGLATRASGFDSEVRTKVASLLASARHTDDLAAHIDNAVVVAAVDMMVDTFDDDQLVVWLSGAGMSRPTREEVAVFSERHPAVAARLATRPGMLGHRLHATAEIIALVRPTAGWGSVIAQDGAREVYTTLAGLIGDDTPLWEPVLGLLDNWNSTLGELVETARRL